jgi:hypothetical protein
VRRRDNLRGAMADFLAKEAQQGRAYPHELWRFALRLDALDQPLGKVWHGVYPEEEPVSILDL